MLVATFEKHFMLTTRIRTYLQKNVGWTEVVIIIAFICLFLWGLMQKHERSSNAATSKGVITGTHKGAKGSVYMDFVFDANGEKIKSWMPYNKNYEIGDTVTVEYQADDPYNNDLIKQ
jgi:hypothetical protein